MKKKITKGVDEILVDFQKFLKNKPSLSQMIDEVRLMKFKIRPVSGNIMGVDLKNSQFIETVWSLGKLEEFYEKQATSLSSKNQELFFRIFDDLYHKYQSDLNKVTLHRNLPAKPGQVLEIEIFKDHRKININ